MAEYFMGGIDASKVDELSDFLLGIGYEVMPGRRNSFTEQFKEQAWGSEVGAVYLLGIKYDLLFESYEPDHQELLERIVSFVRPVSVVNSYGVRVDL